MRPLIVGQITGVSQFAAVIAPAVLCRPHRCPSSNQATTLESQPIQGIQYVSGQTLRDPVSRVEVHALARHRASAAQAPACARISDISVIVPGALAVAGV